jgi:hypothetical protein
MIPTLVIFCWTSFHRAPASEPLKISIPAQYPQPSHAGPMLPPGTNFAG